MKTQPTVYCHSLTSEGMEIVCNDRLIKVLPEQLVVLLRQTGWIEDFFIGDDLTIVTHIIEEMANGNGEIEEVLSCASRMTWSYYVRNFELPDECANDILAALLAA